MPRSHAKKSPSQLDKEIATAVRLLSPAQERVLLRKHLTGDFGKHAWSTIQSLITAGYLADNHGRLQVTPKGRAYCDAHHLQMGL